MNLKTSIAACVFAFSSVFCVFAQNGQTDLSKSVSEKKSDLSAVDQTQQNSDATRERRTQAYAKLLEGQRYLWYASRVRSQTQAVTFVKLAKQALQKSVELDPNLAEGYTALADLAKNPQEIDESILLAGIAVKIDPNNFGAHQILAQLYTIKSGLNTGGLDSNYAQKAISEWNEIARLDPRNAEAFAFLSELYERIGKKAERITALKNWLAASPPLTDGFYGIIFKDQSLAPQNATLKLGQALLDDNKNSEAVEVLSRAVSDEPENSESIELLRLAIKSADNDSIKIAIQALQQAAYANPDNPNLSVLLAQVESRTGKIDDAVKVLRDASAKFAGKDKVASADLQVALADIYSETNQIDEAAAVYKNALAVRGIVTADNVLMDKEREFAVQVYEKLINLYTKANRPNDAKATIERARLVLGNKDLFAEKKMIS